MIFACNILFCNENTEGKLAYPFTLISHFNRTEIHSYECLSAYVTSSHNCKCKNYQMPCFYNLCTCMCMYFSDDYCKIINVSIFVLGIYTCGISVLLWWMYKGITECGVSSSEGTYLCTYI